LRGWGVCIWGCLGCALCDCLGLCGIIVYESIDEWLCYCASRFVCVTRYREVCGLAVVRTVREALGGGRGCSLLTGFEILIRQKVLILGMGEVAGAH
jgi:hypothetical protein